MNRSRARFLLLCEIINTGNWPQQLLGWPTVEWQQPNIFYGRRLSPQSEISFSAGGSGSHVIQSMLSVVILIPNLHCDEACSLSIKTLNDQLYGCQLYKCCYHRRKALPSVLWRCWFSRRKGIRPVKIWSDEVLAWLSVWSEVQMICIWFSWCHCHPIVSCFSKIQNGLSFWYRPTQVVLEKSR